MIVDSSTFSYELIDLGAGVVPKDINNAGMVVGSRHVAEHPAGAFRYSVLDNHFEDLSGTVANAVNDAGQVVGNTLTGAFLLDGNSLRTWDEQGAYGINELTHVAGNKAGKNPYRPTSTPYNPAVYDSGRWSVMDIAQVYPGGTRQGMYADNYLLDDVNDTGYAVGSRHRTGLPGSSAIMISPPYSEVRYASDVTNLPTRAGGTASAINNRNIVVGTTGNDPRVSAYATAFVYDGSSLTLLDPLPGGLRSSCMDINESDTVVGSSETGGLNHAFMWNETTGVVDLNGLIDAPRWVLVYATALNENGDIVGTGQLDGRDHGFLLVNGARREGSVASPYQFQL